MNNIRMKSDPFTLGGGGGGGVVVVVVVGYRYRGGIKNRTNNLCEMKVQILQKVYKLFFDAAPFD